MNHQAIFPENTIPLVGRGRNAPALQGHEENGELGYGGDVRYFHDYAEPIDYTAAFRSGRQAMRTMNDMYQDPVVYASLEQIIQAVTGGEWYVTGENDKEVEFVAQCLGLNGNESAISEELSWTEYNRNMALSCGFGNAYHEKVYMMDGSFLVPRKLGYRAPISLYETLFEHKTFVGIRQQIQGVQIGSYPIIPKEKMSYHIFRKQGDNHYGQGLMRKMFDPWYRKTNFEKIQAIAFEKYGIPIPVLRKKERKPMAPGTVTQGQDNEGSENRLKNSLKTFRGTKSASWVDSDIHELDRFDVPLPYDMLPVIEREDFLIEMVALATFIGLGRGNSGNRAIAGTQSDNFYNSTISFCDALSLEYTRFAKEVRNSNYTSDAPIAVTYRGIMPKSAEEIADIDEKTGALLLTMDDVNQYRGQMEFDEIDEMAYDLYKERMRKKWTVPINPPPDEE